jgi:hypothetical protein
MTTGLLRGHRAGGAWRIRRAVSASLAAALASSGLMVAATTAPAAAGVPAFAGVAGVPHVPDVAGVPHVPGVAHFPGVVGVSTAPGQLLSASLAAARREAGVDWVGTSHVSDTSVTLTTKAGRQDGVQSINFRIGAKAGQVSIILVGTTVYLQGNVFGLQQYLGFSASAAQKETGHWLSIAEPDATLVTIFETVAAGLTVSSTVSELAMSGPLTETAAKKVSGQNVVGIRGTTLPDSETPSTPQVLYVKSTGEHLPVEAVQLYKTETSSEVLGPWGQAPPAHAPAGAVPFQVSWLSGR